MGNAGHRRRPHTTVISGRSTASHGMPFLLIRKSQQMPNNDAPITPHWRCHVFAKFTLHTLYQVLALRAEVFVLEQASLYRDLDGLDLTCHHLSGYDNREQLLAYARIIPQDTISIGRVVVAPHARGQGLGTVLMQRALAYCQAHYPNRPIKLSAQQAAQALYTRLGFVVSSTPYEDAGIVHIDMEKGLSLHGQAHAQAKLRPQLKERARQIAFRTLRA